VDTCPTGRALGEVSVAAPVRRAGVARATFSLHYGGMRALAVDACADVVSDAVDALHAWRGTPDPLSPPPALVDFFARITPHAALYTVLLTPGGGPLGEVLHRELRERSRAERALAGAAPAPEVVASAVTAAFAGVRCRPTGCTG
jgi:AcrR family transcriptional regulator